MHILIVEDEIKTAAYLQKGLSQSGYVVDVAHDGEDGLYLALSREYDLIVLDVMLPNRSGLSVLAEIRHKGKQIPVLFLSARDAAQHRVKGLELGADDYLVKPFSFSELLIRIRNILQRSPARQFDILHIADLDIDQARHRIRRGGVNIDLTPKEFALLSLLIRRKGEVLSRSVIADQVWGINFDSETNAVDVMVRRLRSKIDGPFERKLIRTVRGVGYVIEEN